MEQGPAVLASCCSRFPNPSTRLGHHRRKTKLEKLSALQEYQANISRASAASFSESNLASEPEELNKHLVKAQRTPAPPRLHRQVNKKFSSKFANTSHGPFEAYIMEGITQQVPSVLHWKPLEGLTLGSKQQ